MVSIDPKLREECHGKIDHLLGLRDNDGLALEASEPMPLPTVMAFDVVGFRFALHQLAWRDDRSIGGPLVRAVHGDVPSRQAIDHLLQCLLLSPPTFPVQQLPGVPIERFPDPEFLTFLLT